ncbi:prenylcysteine oxidase 1-like isoform X2 [Centruroides vittatus]
MKDFILELIFLLPLVGVIYSEHFPRIAIIGGGIGGTSAAHFVRNLFQNQKCDIHLYEPSNIGGRLATVEISGRKYEAGGSIVHEKNFYMKNLSESLGLKRRDPVSGLLGIYNGKEYVFKETKNQAVNIGKLLWRYGWSIIKLWFWIKSMLDNFVRIYVIQDKGYAFSGVSQLLYAMEKNFPNYTQESFKDYMMKSGFSEKLTSEIGQSVTRVNYGQTTNVNAFVGAVSLAASDSGLWSVSGGNKEVPEKLLEKANVVVHKKPVLSITLMKDESFEIKESMDSASALYDVVIVAVPLIDGISKIKFNNFPTKIQNFKGKYHRTVATYVNGKVNMSAIGLQPADHLDGVITINPELPFNSLGKVYPVDYKKDETVPEVWKIFSQKPLTDDFMSEMFESITEVKVVDWLAYPQYTPPDALQPFVLHPGLYYVNAIEWAASAMEMSIIAARNAALLSYYYWMKTSDMIDNVQLSSKDEL